MNDRVVYLFRGFRLDRRRRRLETSDGAPILLTPKAFDALVYLLERPGDVVSRREMIDGLWPHTVVDENNLSQLISAVRRAVGKDCVATLPGRGYQLVADLRITHEPAEVALERPDGAVGDESASSTDVPQPAAVREAALPVERAARKRRIVVPAAAGIVFAAVGVAYLLSAGSLEGGLLGASEAGGAAGATVAVLPFTDMSPSGDFDFWADGISTELSNVLARIAGLQVTPASSAFRFEGRDVDLATIAEALGVRYVLEGEVRAADDRLRISVRLSDTRSGFQIWNETYPTGDAEYFPIGDFFSVQDAIARAVAQSLEVTLGVGSAGTRLGMTRDARAFREYLLAGDLISVREAQDPALFRTTVGHLERAVAIDPGFSLAWLGIAQRYMDMRTRGIAPGEMSAAVERTEFAIAHVQSLTPDLPELALFWPNWAGATDSRRDFFDLEDRVARYLAAAERHRYPLPERINIQAIFLRYLGRVTESLPLLEQAYRLDPLSGRVATNLMAAYAIIGDVEAAFDVADELERRAGEKNAVQAGQEVIVALGSSDPDRIAQRLAWFERNAGTDDLNVRMGKLLTQPARALAELHREFSAAEPDEVPWMSPRSAWAAYFGDHELALEMQRQVLEHDRGNEVEGFVLNVPLPIFSGMRRLEGFEDLVADVGLEAYWRATGRWSDYCRPVDAEEIECF